MKKRRGGRLEKSPVWRKHDETSLGSPAAALPSVHALQRPGEKDAQAQARVPGKVPPARPGGAERGGQGSHPGKRPHSAFRCAGLGPVPLPYGVPYLFGGQAPSHVFAKKPDYVVQKAWQSNKNYYRAGKTYLYGFDCVGYVKWVWRKAYESDLSKMEQMLSDRKHHLFSSSSKNLPGWTELAQALTPGDIFIVKYPGLHTGFFIGTLRDYGYTPEEVPELAEWLEAPLVIHSHSDATVSDRFAYLLKHGLRKYRAATVTDGGVSVSLLCGSTSIAPYQVRQQNHTTYYFVLPDNTWLPVFGWKNIPKYCWYRK